MENQEQKGAFNSPKWESKPKIQPHPSKRWCHTAVIYGNYIYIVGGRLSDSAKPKEYVYRINCETFQSEQVVVSDNSLVRESHSCCLVGDYLYVFFGISKQSVRYFEFTREGVIFFFIQEDCLKIKLSEDTLSPEKISIKVPIEGRESFMYVTLKDKYILIYGGNNQKEEQLREFFLYNIKEKSWRKVENVTGEIRVTDCGTMLRVKKEIYVFGGYFADSNHPSNELYRIEFKNYESNSKENEMSLTVVPIESSGPKPRPRANFASCVYRDRYLIILGGQAQKEDSEESLLLNDIWVFDVEKKVWEQLLPQNNNIFKARSSFTATVYKDCLIVFGGLIAFKEFKKSDEILVLNLNNIPEKKPICHLCRTSYKPLPRPQTIVTENSTATMSNSNFFTGISTIINISKTIDQKFDCIRLLLHTFSQLNISKCNIAIDTKISLQVLELNISKEEFNRIITSYHYAPLIRTQNPRIDQAIAKEIRENKINYLSYNLKNAAFGLGRELLVIWNGQDECKACLVNQFGVFWCEDSEIQKGECMYPSHASIVLDHIKYQGVDISELAVNSMVVVISTLNGNFVEDSSIYNKGRGESDLKMTITEMTHAIQESFWNELPFELDVEYWGKSLRKETNGQSLTNSLDISWLQQNVNEEVFERICASETESEKSAAFLYKYNCLMHKAPLKSKKGKNFYFILKDSVSHENMTFTSVVPTPEILSSIKEVIKKPIQTSVSNTGKRSLPAEEKTETKVKSEKVSLKIIHENEKVIYDLEGGTVGSGGIDEE